MQISKREKEKLNGFTIIELLVVIAVISIVTAFVLISYPGLNRVFSLQRSASKLAQDVRMVEERAVSMIELNGIPPAGYGIHLENGSYSYKISAYEEKNLGDWSATDTWEETINLEDGIKISELKEGSVSTSTLDIVFEPPDPTVWINNSSSSSSTITIFIETEPTKTESIFVNSAGLINTR
jgi:prepilin-type N-terminal cleavage/methylation domain-containing protein